MTTIKDLLQKSDIRTMKKDIRQLRKGIFFVKPKQKVEITKNAIPKELDAKQGVKEKEILEKILAESAKQRYEVKKEQPVVETKIEKPGEKKWMEGIADPAKEKLAVETKSENEQRKKFMEDIERWSAESDKN